MPLALTDLSGPVLPGPPEHNSQAVVPASVQLRNSGDHRDSRNDQIHPLETHHYWGQPALTAEKWKSVQELQPVPTSLPAGSLGPETLV
jgi:hypothetical protein